jgi:hypothetical protein
MRHVSTDSFRTAARLLVGLLLFVIHLPAAAQAPTWQSAQAVATATTTATGNYSAVSATAVDAAGNVFLAGHFANTVVLGGTTLTSLGGYDVFVAKFNPVSNQFVWAQRAGGTGFDYAAALAVSGTSVYVAGSVQSSIADFGPISITGAGADDVFVAKLTDAGSTSSFAWVQRAGGTATDQATALAVSGPSVYVAGRFNSPTTSIGTTTLTNANPGYSDDVFVAKLTDAGSTGSFVWAQRAGGADDDQATALAVSGTGVFMAGYFNSATVGFGPTTLTNATAGYNDVFIVKLTDAGSTGSFAWAQRAGGANADYPTALAVSGPSVYVAGRFNSATADFGPTTLTNAGSTSTADVFVAKLTDAGSTGRFAWAQQAGGTGTDQATALAVSGPSVYVAGAFVSPTVGFGPTTLTNVGSNDIFVAKLTDAGRVVWGQQAGGTGYDVAFSLALSGSRVFVTGNFNSYTAAFGAITLPNTIPSTILGFLAALTDPTLTATTTAAGPRELATLFPNPTHRTTTLRLPAGTPPAPLVLTDALGRAVRHYPAPAGPETALDLRGLSAGLYLLRGAGSAQRLVVE